MIKKFFNSKISTYSKAKMEGEISDEILVEKSKDVLVCGKGVYEYCSKEGLGELLNSLNRGGAGGRISL